MSEEADDLNYVGGKWRDAYLIHSVRACVCVQPGNGCVDVSMHAEIDRFDGGRSHKRMSEITELSKWYAN